MSGNPKQVHIYKDDIDLLVVVEHSIRFIARFRWLFTIAIVTGLVLGFARYKTLPTLYKSRILLQPNLLSNQNYLEIVSNWNALLKSGEKSELAELFHCDERMLRKVKQLKADELQKMFTPNNPNGFIIDAYVTDVSALPALQQAILNGFDNSAYTRQKLDAKRKRLTEMIDRSNLEIARLDSTKRRFAEVLRGTGAAASSLIVDAAGVNRLWVELNEKKLNLEEDLRFSGAVLLLQGFGAFHSPAGPNLYLWLFVGVVGAVFLAYVYAVALTIWQKLLLRRLAKRLS